MNFIKCHKCGREEPAFDYAHICGPVKVKPKINERIKLLKHQASQWCDENIPEQFSEETNGYGSAWEDKFAELIVRECVDIVSKVPNGYRDYRNQIEDAMRADCLQAIQEHFGVEE